MLRIGSCVTLSFLAFMVGCGDGDTKDATGVGGADAGQPAHDAGQSVHEAGPLPPPVQCGEPSGTAYYVSPSGDDASAGTESAPWRTLDKATSTAAAGDTVYLMPGTWSERLIPKASGKEGAYITFAAASLTERPIIDGSALGEIDGGLVHLEGMSWVKLCNLVVTGSSRHGIMTVPSDDAPAAHIAIIGVAVEDSGQAGIYFEGVTDASVEQSRTHDSVSSGIGVWYSSRIAVRGNTVVNARYDEDRGHEESISISGTDEFEVTDNEVYLEPGVPCTGGNAAIKAKESSHHGTIHHNYVHDFYPEGHISLDAWEAGLDGTPSLHEVEIFGNRIESSGGIRVSSEELGTVEDIRIYNNVILRTDNGIMITSAGKGGPRRNISIYNNTIYEGNDEWFNGIWVMTLDAENVLIQNNIVVSDYGVAKIMAFDSALQSTITVDHNLVFGPEACLDGYPDCVLLSTLPGNLNAEPGFVDAEGGDLHLRADSPAVDQGAAIPALNNDVEGTSRPQGDGVDIGAYERVSP